MVNIIISKDGTKHVITSVRIREDQYNYVITKSGMNLSEFVRVVIDTLMKEETESKQVSFLPKITIDISDDAYVGMKINNKVMGSYINTLICKDLNIPEKKAIKKLQCERFIESVSSRIKEELKLEERQTKALLKPIEDEQKLKKQTIEYINQNGGKREVLKLYERSFIDDRYSTEWNAFLTNAPVKFNELMKILKEIE